MAAHGRHVNVKVRTPFAYVALCVLRHSTDSIYCIPIQAPLSTIREIKSRAILLDAVMKGVEIKHPLVRDAHIIHRA